ncbi:MAG: hypothetical protein HC921_18115 [Synechococcaceae cyanobacterium SM2_3_1]|nr:hypothetical protein [Synechococcaceae cyanobacterium SM2_3_1]
MKLGQILIRRQLISERQLQEALRLQRFRFPRLGQILVMQGLLSPQDLQAALEEQHWRRHGFWVI